MIYDSLKMHGLNAFDVIIEPLEDSVYNDTKWIADVQNIVNSRTILTNKIALIGHSKDHSSYYLKLFPQWDSIDVESFTDISSTQIRNDYFSNVPVYGVENVPAGTNKFLNKFYRTTDYQNIVEEYAFVEKYKRAWDCAPYAPTFVTVDACVVQSGHVLLIQRKARPGKGLWALPGGFLNVDERISTAVIRELKEETKIDVPIPVLNGSLVITKVFDDPFRSSRGRTITHASLFHLTSGTKLPKIKGSDDAMAARWVPLAEISSENMYEDHYHMIVNLISNL
jgi:bifunctional NMN adenylyltransferase/nudix hydrolase